LCDEDRPLPRPFWKIDADLAVGEASLDIAVNLDRIAGAAQCGNQRRDLLREISRE